MGYGWREGSSSIKVATWGCAAKEGIHFRTPSLAKGILFGNFSLGKGGKGGKGMLFYNFGQRSVNFW